MKRILYIFPVLLLLVACEWDTTKQNTPTTDPDPETKENLETTRNPDNPNWICIPGKQVGAITPNSTEKELVNFFGAENVKRENLSLEEGVVVQGTVIYPDSPNQLIIEWLPGQLYQKPAIIRIEGEGAQWVTASGVSVGTTLDQLISINSQPISFFGFEWDYSGLVDSWGGGKVDSNLVVFLAPGKPEAIFPELLGDQVFTSDHPKAQAAELYVISMMIPLNEEESQE